MGHDGGVILGSGNPLNQHMGLFVSSTALRTSRYRPQRWLLPSRWFWNTWFIVVYLLVVGSGSVGVAAQFVDHPDATSAFLVGSVAGVVVTFFLGAIERLVRDRLETDSIHERT